MMKPYKTIPLALAAVLSLAFVAPAYAQTSAPAEPAATSGAPLTLGEIRKVDKDLGKLTIKHGPISNLDMPPMTMIFKVGNPTMLDQVKVGDKVRFDVERANGAMTVVRMETIK